MSDKNVLAIIPKHGNTLYVIDDDMRTLYKWVYDKWIKVWEATNL